MTTLPEHQAAADLMREIRAKEQRVIDGLITELQAAGYEATIKRDKSAIDSRIPQWMLLVAERQDRELSRRLLLLVDGEKVSVVVRPIVSRKRYEPTTVSGRLAVSVGPGAFTRRGASAGSVRVAEGAKGFSYARLVAAVREVALVSLHRREESKRRRAAAEAREGAVERVRQAAFSDHDVDSAEGMIGLRLNNTYDDDRPVELTLECDEATALAVVQLLRERHATPSASQEQA